MLVSYRELKNNFTYPDLFLIFAAIANFTGYLNYILLFSTYNVQVHFILI